MKRILVLFVLSSFFLVPSFAQKMTKAQKEEAARQAYETALQCIEDRKWVIVPSSYQAQNGDILSSSNTDIFLSYEGTAAFSQGAVVCSNDKTNTAEVTSYEVTVDKKGNVKVLMVVQGRMWKGTYKITMRNKGNLADVIFTQPTGPTLRFSGPLESLVGAVYNKRSNPI